MFHILEETDDESYVLLVDAMLSMAAPAAIAADVTEVLQRRTATANLNVPAPSWKSLILRGGSDTDRVDAVTPTVFTLSIGGSSLVPTMGEPL